MTRQEFLKAVRRDGEKFRAERITIGTGKQDLRGRGTLRVSKDRIILEVALDDPTKEVQMPAGFVGRSNLWEIRGVIEDELKFLVHDLPSCSSKHFGEEAGATLTFSTDHLELEPAGFDRMTYEEIAVMHKHIRASVVPKAQDVQDKASPGNSLKAPEGSLAPNPETQHPAVTFNAILQDFALIAHNGGTQITEKNDYLGESTRSTLDTYHGEVMGWKFGLIQRDRDLDIHLQSKPDHCPQSDQHEERLFRAFLNALAFTHGQHAWPFSLEHRRSHKLVLDRIHLHGAVAHTPHAPFTKRLSFNVKLHGLQWDYQDALEKAFRFFAQGSKLSQEITQLLFVLRESSTSGVPKAIALLTLCSLFESLVHVIYDEQIALSQAADNAAFQEAKNHVCEYLKTKAAQSSSSTQYERISAIVVNATPVNSRTKFYAIVQQLNLTPAEKWYELYSLWRKCRNPLSHRMTDKDDSEESAKEAPLAESQIAGAINCIVLKLMGYSGWMRASAYEDNYVQI